MKKTAFFKIFSIFTLSFFLFSCKFQQQEQKKRVVIWTSCSEFVQYIELFNKTHKENNAILVYKEKAVSELFSEVNTELHTEL